MRGKQPNKSLFLVICAVFFAFLIPHSMISCGSTNSGVTPFGDGWTQIDLGYDVGKDTNSKPEDKGGPQDTGDEEKDFYDDEDVPALPGEPGWPCEDNSDCNSLFCIEGPDGKVCAQPCVDSCPEGFVCTSVSSGSDDQFFICVYPDLNLCRPCTNSEACKGPASSAAGCVDFGLGGSFCGMSCFEDTDCQDGYLCSDVLLTGGVPDRQCIPQSGSCECSKSAIEDAAMTTCYVENEHGTCSGTRACIAEGLTECNAPEPAPEVCGDSIDNNCDGVIDEDCEETGCTVNNCTNYYEDNDDDGFGPGAGVCVCEPPSDEHVTQGGDCNDLNEDVNPSAVEACNNLDDNCDGIIDNVGAIGCQPAFVDADGDGFGDPDIPACACSIGDGFSDVAGDCDDKNADVSPAITELCGDFIDNDCNGEIDEESASGCQLFFLDGDGDGFGVTDDSKCLCEPTPIYKAHQSGDCNDSVASIYPSAKEQCNGVDDDCDLLIDEDSPYEMCPIPPFGEPKCDGACGVDGCLDGWYDLNGIVGDGCECKADVNDHLDNLCSNPRQLGSLSDVGEKTVVKGRIVPGTDSDWFQVHAIDTADDSCDQFNFKVQFINNPNDSLAVDVYRGSCSGSNQVCTSQTSYSFATNFRDDATKTGQCPCTTIVTTGGEVGCNNADNQFEQPAGEFGGPCLDCSPDEATDKCVTFPHYSVPGKNRCTDESATFFIRVHVKPGYGGILPCGRYELEISNGIYAYGE